MSKTKVPFERLSAAHSLRLKILLAFVGLTLFTAGTLDYYTTSQFEKATLIDLKHEGLLLSDVLEASIMPYLRSNDTKAMQAQIDRLVESREFNDIEINILSLNEKIIEIVASNCPDNIEAADKEECQDLMKVMAMKKPHIYVEVEDDDNDPDDIVADASHPDYYLEAGGRFLSVTIPLFDDLHPLGGINVKLSLQPLDEQLGMVKKTLLAAMGLEVIIIVLGMGFMLFRRIFLPLRKMGDDMQRIARGDLEHRLALPSNQNEIGILAKAFNSMTEQLALTRRQLHQYLNPNAIEEAYRKAEAGNKQALAINREISVLFVDIVSFTTMTERLGPGGTVAYLNRFYDLITAALVDSNGYIDKFVADEAVCVFDGNNHADQAVRAANEILYLLTTESTEDAAMPKVRIGINTGNCIIADIGSARFGRLDRTIIGDTVNVAQRLMTAGDPNSTMFSEKTYNSLNWIMTGITRADQLMLKGKTIAVQAYRLSPPVSSWKSQYLDIPAELLNWIDHQPEKKQNKRTVEDLESLCAGLS